MQNFLEILPPRTGEVKNHNKDSRVNISKSPEEHPKKKSEKISEDERAHQIMNGSIQQDEWTFYQQGWLPTFINRSAAFMKRF